MQDTARPAIAYIAGRLHTGRNASSVYDYSRGGHVSMSGQVSAERVNVYDYGRSCHISGRPTSLYDYGQSNHIQLKMKENGSFQGYDYASGQHFSGRVSGRNVSLYDHGTGRHYNFQV